ncbi:unnamed protein product (macronuclear) [Paramecium tetraurelia]|uniref:SAC3/GANP/THP3 conserved domain-containing protein n=1 Tax=Paramecium tetraurelia TaxID=5888 RepID=A0C339_PARTE|nr:uncharacterized protein GSPATT00034684001 [Paramecium tetraurelia]CAK65206.1 unnamed protein product [Paramecium tetraurelia]|eukprot:XP_001432603.1 hypothetical protein (macronuclear) [Paramecium tetraurelia strain d4-2]
MNNKRQTIEDAMRAEQINSYQPQQQGGYQNYYGYNSNVNYRYQPNIPVQYQYNQYYQYNYQGVGNQSMMQNNFYRAPQFVQQPSTVFNQQQNKFQPPPQQQFGNPPLPQQQSVSQQLEQQSIQQQSSKIQIETNNDHQFLPPVNISELDQPTRWESELKVYSYLYRKLNVEMPNLVSARFCNSREVFNEQSSITVKQYVERAFNKCQSDEERNIMEQHLKATIAEAKRKNEYTIRDWSKFPLPTLQRENQIRTQSLFSSNLQIKQSTAMALSSLGQTSKFGAPSQAQPTGPAQKITASTNLHNLISLYDQLVQQQVESINQNHMKNKKIDYSMDLAILQIGKLQPNATTQIKQQQKQLKKRIEEEDQIIETNMKIIGTCEDLEKPYFRLTGLPDPNMIRPEHILKKALAQLLDKWKNCQADYNFIIEQFRSIRQDLLVQHIENRFTVQVYEENARICLECGDFPRYESCWTMLVDLYEMISISEGKDVNLIGNKVEFDSYRIFYLTMLNKQDQLVKIMHQNLDDSRIKFALGLRESFKCGNYVKLFKDYKESSDTMGSIINHFLVRIRVRALKQIVKTYISNIDLEYLADLLAFQDVEQFKQFMQFFDLVRFDETLKFLLIKQSINAFDNINFDKMNE